MKISHTIAIALLTGAVAATAPVAAQDTETESAGTDELDASLSAESGDELDARRANAQYDELKYDQGSMNDRMDDLERRIKALEDAQK